MSEPTDFELLELATPYALDAVSDTERADIERRLAEAPAAVSEAFDAGVREVRETMAAMSTATAAEPPVELRRRVLQTVAPRSDHRRSRWRSMILAAAAAVVVGLAAVGVELALRPAHAPSTAEQVF